MSVTPSSLRSLRSRRWLAGPLALIALAVILGSVFFLTTGTARGQNDLVSTNPVDILAGQQLFEAHCQSCHGYQGGGATGPALVSVGAAAADFYLTTGRMPLNNPGNQASRHRPFFDPQQIRRAGRLRQRPARDHQDLRVRPDHPDHRAPVPDHHARPRAASPCRRGSRDSP